MNAEAVDLGDPVVVLLDRGRELVDGRLQCGGGEVQLRQQPRLLAFGPVQRSASRSRPSSGRRRPRRCRAPPVMPSGSKIRLTVLKMPCCCWLLGEALDRLAARSARCVARTPIWARSCWLDPVHQLLLRDRVGLEDADVDLGADEALRQVVERRPERVVEDRAAEDPVVLDQPGVVDLVRVPARRSRRGRPA